MLSTAAAMAVTVYLVPQVLLLVLGEAAGLRDQTVLAETAGTRL
jgi:hypothetical protein